MVIGLGFGVRCHIWNELRIPVPTELFAHTEQGLLTGPQISFSVTAVSLRRRGMLDASGKVVTADAACGVH